VGYPPGGGTTGGVVAGFVSVPDVVVATDEDGGVELPLVLGTGDVTVAVTVDVDVEMLVPELGAAITPHATRLPASPVASVSGSGPPVPLIW